jgi:hypothetical protein
MTNIEKYLEMTGQSLQDLLAGEQQYGSEYIDKLIDQALDQKKKVVFVPELTEGHELGLGRYELQDL